MNQFSIILLISFANIFQFFIGFIECRRMIWQQRTNIGDALNWDGDELPCSTDSLLFPQKSYDIIKLSNFTMKEFILPKSGGFVLDSKMSLNFRERDTKCKKNEMRSFKSVIQTPWLMSSNWQTTHENGNGKVMTAAMPHDERIPCDNDEIIFPINNSYVVDLQSIPLMTFKSIAIDGRLMTLNEFKDFLFTTYGQSLFKNFDNIQFIEYEDCSSIKCQLCHRKGDSLRQQLCENEKPFCQPIPHCSDPIKPIGHCCNECGALFQMKLPYSERISTGINNFNLDDVRGDIYRAINSALSTGIVDENKIAYHISVTTEENQLYLQLIIVDRYEYDEQSTRLMKHLRKVLLDKRYKDQSKFYFISGLPFTPNESGHVLSFIFGTFFLVTLFMTLIYIVYYDDRHIPRLMAMIRNRRLMLHSDVIFARFDNTSHANEMMASAMSNHDDDDDAHGSMEVDLHFGTDQSIENVNQAFNNPMFDATSNIRDKSRDESI
ncbi:hypothetical protein ACKWTF_009407 [Chironomus riparius]